MNILFLAKEHNETMNWVIKIDCSDIKLKFITLTTISYFSSSPGLMAITFPSTTAIAPLVAADTKSLVI